MLFTESALSRFAKETVRAVSAKVTSRLQSFTAKSRTSEDSSAAIEEKGD